MGQPNDKGESGWILLSRGVVDHPVFRGPPDLTRLWILLLTSAHGHDRPHRMPEGELLYKGELVTTLGKLSRALRRRGDRKLGEPHEYQPKRSTVMRWLRALKDDKSISIASTRSSGTRIRILNYDHWQTFASYRRNRPETSQPVDRHGESQTQLGLLATDRGGIGNRIGNSCSQQPDRDATMGDNRESSDDEGRIGNSPESSGCNTVATPTTTQDTHKVTTRRRKAPPAGGSAGGRPPALRLDYDTGKWNRHPTEEETRRWKAACPAIDLGKEMAKATNWLMDLPKNKRKKNFKAFLNNWFNIAQDKKEKYG